MTTKTKRQPMPAEAAMIPPEWHPQHVDGETARWGQAVAHKLNDYANEVAMGDRDEGALRHCLGETIAAIAERADLLLQFRGWPLAIAVEKASDSWLRASGHYTGPSLGCDLKTPCPALMEGWVNFCRPPEPETTRTVPLESLAQLDALVGMTDGQKCQIYATGDRNEEDESKFGPWVFGDYAGDAIPAIPSPNLDRLRAAREGKAKVPTGRTIKTRPTGWPSKCPLLIMLRQAAELVRG